MSVTLQYRGLNCPVHRGVYPTGTIKLVLKHPQTGTDVKVITTAIASVTEQDKICIASDYDSQMLVKTLMGRGLLRQYGYALHGNQQIQLCVFNF